MKRTKAILLINLSGSLVGGAQRRYVQLFKYLQKGKRDFLLIINNSLLEKVFCHNLLNDKEKIEVINLPRQYRLSKVSRLKIENGDNSTLRQLYYLLGRLKLFGKYFIYWLSYSYQLRKIIRTYNIDLIYGIFTGGIWAWPLQFILRFKLIYSYNDSSLSTISSSLLKVFDSELWAIKYSKKIDLLSPDILRRLEEKGIFIPTQKISISPNSFVNYEDYYPVYPKLDRVILLSRLTEIKNPGIFIEAVKILHERNETADYEFLIIGEGPLSFQIEDLINNCSLTKLKYLGPVNNSYDLLRQSKIFISIQKFNNYPSQSLLEAMACENAIIASDVGETRLLVSEEEGILVKLEAEQIADAMYKLISEPEITNKLGQNARLKAIQNHTIEKYAGYFCALMESV